MVMITVHWFLAHTDLVGEGIGAKDSIDFSPLKPTFPGISLLSLRHCQSPSDLRIENIPVFSSSLANTRSKLPVRFHFCHIKQVCKSCCLLKTHSFRHDNFKITCKGPDYVSQHFLAEGKGVQICLWYF